MTIINFLLSALVLYAVVYRLAHARGQAGSLRARLSCNAWVAAHALIGAGCVGYIGANISGIEPRGSITMLLSGLALLLLFKWQRRKGETP